MANFKPNVINFIIITAVCYSLLLIETCKPFSPIQKYFNNPECNKNICEEIMLYTMYILLHIAIIHTGFYTEGVSKPF